MSGGRIKDGVFLGGTEITPEGVFEVQHGKRFHFVARAKIQRIGIGRGFLSDRAVPLFAVGGLLVVVGAFLAISGVINVGASSAGDFRSWSIFTVAALLFGGHMVLQASKRGVYLRVDGPGGEQRLAIGKSAERDAIEKALSRAATEFGYEIAREDLEQFGRTE